MFTWQWQFTATNTQLTVTEIINVNFLFHLREEFILWYDGMVWYGILWYRFNSEVPIQVLQIYSEIVEPMEHMEQSVAPVIHTDVPLLSLSASLLTY